MSWIKCGAWFLIFFCLARCLHPLPSGWWKAVSHSFDGVQPYTLCLLHFSGSSLLSEVLIFLTVVGSGWMEKQWVQREWLMWSDLIILVITQCNKASRKVQLSEEKIKSCVKTSDDNFFVCKVQLCNSSLVTSALLAFSCLHVIQIGLIVL